MASLSFKSSDELCKLLDEYGINHGPIVDSTRKLYEKKLSDAMAKKTNRPSDKTYYREEEEEITLVRYHPP
ncbi:emerin isoform X1, partial [Silurus asotus]